MSPPDGLLFRRLQEEKGQENRHMRLPRQAPMQRQSLLSGPIDLLQPRRGRRRLLRRAGNLRPGLRSRQLLLPGLLSARADDPVHPCRKVLPRGRTRRPWHVEQRTMLSAGAIVQRPMLRIGFHLRQRSVPRLPATVRRRVLPGRPDLQHLRPLRRPDRLSARGLHHQRQSMLPGDESFGRVRLLLSTQFDLLQFAVGLLLHLGERNQRGGHPCHG